MEIVLENVSVEYKTGPNRRIQALSDLNLELREKERVALVGPSGSGKSTLLRLLAGLVPPNKGKVEGIGKKGRAALSIQEPQRGFFGATVREEVAFGPKNLELSSQEVKKRVKWALDVVGFPEKKRGFSPFTLSGGEQRRVALASIISMKPTFLLLDEPTTGLDGSGKKQLSGLLQKLVEEHKLSLVIASHDPDFLFPLTQRVLVLDKGVLILDTNWRSLAGNPSLLNHLGIGLPTILNILRTLRILGAPIQNGFNKYQDALTELRKLITEGTKE